MFTNKNAMPMPTYSVDLRQRVLEAYLNGEGSQEQVAERFSVSRSFLQKLLYRYRQSGSVEPKAHGGGQSPKITEEDLPELRSLLEASPDATLEELCEDFQGKTGTSVSVPTMHRAIERLDWTRKKRPSGPANKTQSASNKSARSSARR